MTPLARQRLHLLYILNDLMHHAGYHAEDESLQSNLRQAFEPNVVELVRLAATDNKAKVCKRLEDLLELWDAAGYFGREALGKARAAINDPSAADNAHQAPTAGITKTTKELPFIMPSTHGDPSLPFYELPAGNFIPHIIPNKSIPMRPEDIRALQFAPGPADESLANAVRDFLKDVETIDDEYGRLDDPELSAEFDEMGQISYRDEAGELQGDTYYGWSRAFCEKMSSRAKSGANGDARRSRSRNSSMSRSKSPRKRRRYSDSSSRMSRSSSRSRSRSRSPPFKRRDSRDDPHPPPPPPEGLRFIPQAPTQQKNNSGGGPYHSQALPPRPQSSFLQAVPPPPSQQHFSPPPPPLGPGGMPIPPPRPPNWQGAWPPPPPPPPPGMGNTGFQPSTFSRPGSGAPTGPRNGYQPFR